MEKHSLREDMECGAAILEDHYEEWIVAQNTCNDKEAFWLGMLASLDGAMTGCLGKESANRVRNHYRAALIKEKLQARLHRQPEALQ